MQNRLQNTMKVFKDEHKARDNTSTKHILTIYTQNYFIITSGPNSRLRFFSFKSKFQRIFELVTNPEVFPKPLRASSTSESVLCVFFSNFQAFSCKIKLQTAYFHSKNCFILAKFVKNLAKSKNTSTGLSFDSIWVMSVFEMFFGAS